MHPNCAYPGIGSVRSLTSASCVHWEEPVFVSADVTNLMYNVSVSGANLLSFTIQTSETQYCPELIPCQEYTVTVTPFSSSPDYKGASSTITYTAPGGTIIRVLNKGTIK